MFGVHEGAVKHLNAMHQIRTIRHDLKGETPWEYFVVSAMKAYVHTPNEHSSLTQAATTPFGNL